MTRKQFLAFLPISENATMLCSILLSQIMIFYWKVKMLHLFL